METLKPNSEAHQKMLSYLLDRINMAEKKMQNFYPRWNAMEKKVQAYVTLPNYEKLLDNMNKQGKPPQVVSIVVPYSFATISTIVTYLFHTFCGRKPILQVGSHKGEKSNAARNMEVMLQYQADHCRLAKHIFQHLQDGQLYGLGATRTAWKEQKGYRTKSFMMPQYNLGGMMTGQMPQRKRELLTVYSGNSTEAIDPFLFFPDPRVPMTDVNTKGEFVFWRTYSGKHELKKLEQYDGYKYVDEISDKLPNGAENRSNESTSSRNLLSGGESIPGRDNNDDSKTPNYIQIDEGTIEIVPSKFGLSNSNNVEKWIFTIGNKSQIIRAELFDADHGKHPVVVSEPYTLGHGFGNPGISDYLGPVQDLVSWLVNSHMANVRTAINNMFVVDPSLVEMGDLKNPGDGKIIRLKRAAYGQDVRSAISQLQVQDITRGHMADTELFMRLGQQLSSATDNIMGMQDAGGRKTATEVRTAGEAAASRLAAQARLISVQAFVDLAEQWVLNTQQYLDQSIEIAVLGEKALQDPIKIGPQELAGDYYFPVHDGTLPMDRVALMDIWKEVFMGVAQDQQLRQTFDVPKLFEFIAELGGAKNISGFKLQPQSPEAIAAGQANGSLVPVGQGGLTAPPAPGRM